MKIVNAKYNLSIELQENKVDELIIENESAMAEIIGNIYNQSIGCEGDFILTENNKEIKFDKNVEVIINPFAVDLNDKKIINKLVGELSGIGNDYTSEKMELNSEIVQIIQKIIDEAQYENISFDMEFDWINLLKLYNVRFETQYEKLLEKIIEYIRILSELCSVKLVCLVNFKSFFTTEEIKQLYEMTFYYKIQLLVIESCEKDQIDNEGIYIIDNDRCLIIK